MALYFAFVIAFSSFAYGAAVTGPADVVLLLDSSDGFRSSYFEKEKEFAINFIEQIYNSENRIGLYTFGRRSHVQFDLNLYSSIDQMRLAINHMWYSTGNGNLEDAIHFTVDNAFTDSVGDRECVPNMLLILTHKTVTDPLTISAIESKLTGKIIRTIILNMANGDATADFVQMTGNSTRIVDIPNLESLLSASTTIANKMDSDLPRSGCGKLTSWGEWSSCSLTCNFGQRFRLRECVKEHDSDKDCEDMLTDDEVCMDATCPVDGGWSYWGSWGGCSKSCGKGTQNRYRTCTRPEPFGGGNYCVGTSTDTRNCNDWSCPDCGKTCPPGGQLSSDCQLCNCASITLYGCVMDDTDQIVEAAEIYLASRRNDPVGKTDIFGKFRVDGICIMNEKIVVQALGHKSLEAVPSEVNLTHWTLNATIETYVAPVFNVNPENKIRLVGQDFTLCCSAVGHPSPLAYKWYKNGKELENQGVDGTLTVLSSTKDDAAVYKCTTESEAGISQSSEAIVSIKDDSVDSCGPPLPKVQPLPAGCFETSDEDQSPFIDVGTCGKSACMSASLQDNGTCSDWWPHYCCDVHDTEMVDITCEGFTYKTARVTSCTCRLCIYKTTVSGRVTGKENGTIVPMQLGAIYIDNEEVAKTNMAGFFKFEVAKGKTRLVATFHDGFRNIFLDVTKIIQVVEGIDNHVTIVVPLKPEPISFNPHIGTEFQLGANKNGDSPLGSLQIQEDSIVTLDGEPFDGTAKATMHFVDPRDRDSIDSANGDFVSESPDGSSVPLETFGMFQFAVNDESGNPLKINKPMAFSFDAEIFKVTLDENGEPELALWDYDVNKGVWVENTRLHFDQDPTGRKLLTKTLRANFIPKDVPPIDHYGTTIKRVWTGRYTNCDKSTKIYENVPVKNSDAKRGACFVNVAVYEDFSLTQPYSKGDATITVYTRDRNKDKYIGVASAPAINGQACIATFCDNWVTISVHNGDRELLRPAQHSLPFGYGEREINREVEFWAVDRGQSYKCPEGQTCVGPMYQHRDSSDCRKVTPMDSTFKFKFAPFTRPPHADYAVGSNNVFDKLLSWYPVSPDKVTFRSCFMKVLLKIDDAYDIRLVAKSLLDTSNGQEFGTYNVGPIPAPGSSDDSVRGACLEFRCPGYVRNGTHEYFDLATLVEAHLTTSDKSKACKLRTLTQINGVTPITNPTRGDTGFRFRAVPGTNYGPIFGVYISDKSADEVEQFCKSGTDAGAVLDGKMDPTKNAAVEFDCL
ncbi:cartilage intermediate layer protein 1-like [Mercenaria mercenaria]|uniref:cartilage intermediate layer protein 1-like n=1 Tax=Mercenaria mercenaria TaxID=6596 RepID=UPI00234F8188|nr:cartilage intermediate layer protein 1-like [Mercenaria mercenaria]